MKKPKKQIYKIVFAGSVGAGKTQAIEVLSDKAIVSTEANATDEVKQLKSNTTVAMDYGVMSLDDDMEIQLYGTPGQKRFDFMWEILSENALGFVLLVNAENEDPVSDMLEYLYAFKKIVKSTIFIVGLTHAENSSWELVETLSEVLIAEGLPALVMQVDARDREQMIEVVQSLVYSAV